MYLSIFKSTIFHEYCFINLHLSVILSKNYYTIPDIFKNIVYFNQHLSKFANQ